MINPQFYSVKNKLYPKLILGSDRFLDIFPKKRSQKQLEEKYIYNVMKTAYQYGAGGFDLNIMSDNLLKAFIKLKTKYGNSVVGIGSPNWKCGYKLGKTNLIDIKHIIINTIVSNYMDKNLRNQIYNLPKKNREFFFKVPRGSKILTNSEISQIYIDEKIWISRLKKLMDISDFCLFGADYADWMILLNRKDLLLWQIETIKKHNMIPLSVCHWTSISLPELDLLEIDGHWTLANLEAMYLEKLSAISAIQNSQKPVTCFRILRGIKIPNEIYKPIKWLYKDIGASSLVIGVDNEEQAKETFSIASKLIM